VRGENIKCAPGYRLPQFYKVNNAKYIVFCAATRRNIHVLGTGSDCWWRAERTSSMQYV